jgi:dienelactone hydrolase
VNVVGDGEAVLVLAPEPQEALVSMLTARFRVLTTGPGEGAADALDELGDARCAVIGISTAAIEALELATAERVDALVLLSPLLPDELPAEAMAAWELPVLIFGGEDDPLVGVDALERLNEAIPSSTLGLLPGCGHDLLADAPETLLPMIHEYLRARYLHAPHGHGAEGVVMLQLEKRPPWVDLAPYTEEDGEPVVPEPDEQEVGPNA